MDNPRIEKKIDKIQEDMSEVKTHLAVYNEQLKIHIKRTEILEEELKPVKTHVERINGVLKFIGFIGLLAGIVKVVFEIVKGI